LAKSEFGKKANAGAENAFIEEVNLGGVRIQTNCGLAKSYRRGCFLN